MNNEEWMSTAVLCRSRKFKLS